MGIYYISRMEIEAKIGKYTMLNNLLLFAQQQSEGLSNALVSDPQNIGFQTQIVHLEHDVSQLVPACTKLYREIMKEIETDLDMEPLRHPALKWYDDKPKMKVNGD